MIDRRQMVRLAAAAAVAGTLTPAVRAASPERTLKAIHKRIGGRLGVHILDSQSGRRIAYDDGARYAMASTFKLMLAAALLWQVDKNAFTLEHELPISRDDLLTTSPDVEAKLKTGATSMTVRDLCAAIVVSSDNAAANILLKGIGGPSGFTTFMRSIGDEKTRLDRTEPDLNVNLPGDPRDTTTPRAMIDSMLRVFTQDVITVRSRAVLIDWMMQSRTGLERVRAGIPKSWQVGDKTGTGMSGAVNDLVLAWPPERRPILIAVYMSESKLALKDLGAAHAEIGRLVADQDWK
ncbi:MAG: class A beta-lactamase [Steroidobacteraceae bacterium]|nr:class A beta-lactamase [Steroidobacteraceae bacterium]